MALVTVENNREHAIKLNVNGQTSTIPGARQNPDDRGQLIPGRARIDSEHINAAQKNPVAKNYFKQGWLTFPNSKPASVPGSEPEKTDPAKTAPTGK